MGTFYAKYPGEPGFDGKSSFYAGGEPGFRAARLRPFLAECCVAEGVNAGGQLSARGPVAGGAKLGAVEEQQIEGGKPRVRSRDPRGKDAGGLAAAEISGHQDAA